MTIDIQSESGEFHDTRKKSLAPFRMGVCFAALQFLAVALQAADYRVGPGQVFSSIAAVPWPALTSGDTVHIHWRPEPYREKILISNSGTAERPVRILGVRGPEGQRPILDGENATTSAQFRFPYSGTSLRGLVIVTRDQSQEDGYRPKYIEIEGLEIRNAAMVHFFLDSQGKPTQYRPNAAAIFIERGEHITIRNCALTGSGNGLFVASGEVEAFQSREILVHGNEIFGNGNLASDREHNVYTEAIGITFEFNRFAPLRPGAMGNNLKDRSAGTVVRFNWIQGGAQQLDLVDAEGSFNQAVADPRYRTTYVYGNLIINEPTNASVIHYGGDSSVTDIYRKGTLYFYHNTVIFRTDQRIRWRVALLRLDTNDESADVRNNILYNVADSPGAPLSELSILSTSGNGHLGVNWVSHAWLPSRTGVPFEGRLTGTESILTGFDPGFSSFETANFTPRSQSPCVDKALPHAGGIPEEFQVLYSPLKPSIPRKGNGAALDLGAFESGSDRALLSIHRLPSGQVQITVRGPAGTYRLERTDDLKSWREAMTGQITDEDLTFLTTGPNLGFFRAVQFP